MMRLRPLPLLMPVLCAVMLAGCFPDPDYSGIPGLSSITVTTRQDRVALDSPPRPDDGRQSQVASFQGSLPKNAVTRYQILLPKGTRGTAYRQWAIALGADPAHLSVIETTSVMAPELLITASVASPPDCQSMLLDSSRVRKEQRATFAFGCATRTNLAAMVADPADLVAPATFAGPDAKREAAAAQRYWDNKTTPLNDTTTLSTE